MPDFRPFAARIFEGFDCDAPDPEQFSPLALAFLGDTVFDTVIRTVIMESGNQTIQHLHDRASEYANAAAQARILDAVRDDLSEEERAIFRRARNANKHSMPKNQSPADYHKATGLEALIGWLFLNGREERMIELIRKGAGL